MTMESNPTGPNAHAPDDLLTGMDLTVQVDPEIADLVPMFLDNRREDVAAVRDALANGDLGAIEDLGHRMKGMGGAYGFDPVTDIGATIERLAGERRADELAPWVAALERYLDRVELL